MKLQNNIGIKGTVQLTALSENGSIRTQKEHNLITFIGLGFLAKALDGEGINFTKIGIGKGTTAATESDHELEMDDPTYYSNTTTHRQYLDDANKIIVTTVFPYGALSASFTEAGIFIDNVMFNRAVYTAFPVTSSEVLIVTWTIEFANV